jgi:hypothetical protein
MTDGMELCHMLDNRCSGRTHAHVIGTSHDDHKIGGDIFKHTYETPAIWANLRRYNIRVTLIQHVLGGEAA